MNTMHHKGYIARIDFDERDSIFVGRVLGSHRSLPPFLYNGFP